jgi:hypothetical protein
MTQRNSNVATEHKPKKAKNEKLGKGDGNPKTTPRETPKDVQQPAAQSGIQGQLTDVKSEDALGPSMNRTAYGADALGPSMNRTAYGADALQRPALRQKKNGAKRRKGDEPEVQAARA